MKLLRLFYKFSGLYEKRLLKKITFFQLPFAILFYFIYNKRIQSMFYIFFLFDLIRYPFYFFRNEHPPCPASIIIVGSIIGLPISSSYYIPFLPKCASYFFFFPYIIFLSLHHISSQIAVSILLKPSPSFPIVRKNLFHSFPEPFRVIHLQKMTKFMYHYIIHNLFRHQY